MGFEAHAIVELMGHSKIAGKVSEENIAGAAMLRIDVPKTERRDGFTKFYSAGAVYSIAPTTEEMALYAAQTFNTPPVAAHILWMPESPSLAAVVAPGDEGPDIEDDNYVEYDDPNSTPSRPFDPSEIPF